MVITKKQHKIQKFNNDFLGIIGHIISDSDFKKLISIRQHLFFNRYEHLLNVSKISYKIAKFLKADIKTCTLAGLLHDYHFTRIKSYIHGILSAENAKRFGVNENVLEIIRSHMYPLGKTKVKRAKGIDFWIVKFADFYSAFYEIIYSILRLSFNGINKIKVKNNKFLLQLQEENYILAN